MTRQNFDTGPDIGVPPYMHSGDTVANIMYPVLLALVPAGIAGIYFFGVRVIALIVVCMVACLLSEWLFQILFRKERTFLDGSALVTGLLMAYCLPSNFPLWLAACASFCAIIFVKQIFGGLGYNVFNPVLAVRVIILFFLPQYMSVWPGTIPGKFVQGIDAVSVATPLQFYEGFIDFPPSNWELFIGNHGGCIGEVCILALLAGGIYLFRRKIISWHIPVTFIGTVMLLGWIIGGEEFYFTGDPLFAVFSGGVVLGALFMATDVVTTPLTNKGKLIFGCGCGLIVTWVRFYTGVSEGASIAILVMNAFVPLIDFTTKPRPYGTGRFLNKRWFYREIGRASGH